jgi:hypothetical protein
MPLQVFITCLRRLLASRSGNIATIAAVSTLPVIALVGAGIDVTRTYNAETVLQQALDQAVIAGARDGSSSWVTTAGSVLTAGLQATPVSSLATTFTKPQATQYKGTATGKVPSLFLGLIGVDLMSVEVTATAVKPEGSSGAGPCVLLMSKTASQSLLVNSGAKVTAPNCEIHVKSTASPAAIFNSGSTLTTSKICIAGSQITDNGGTHPNLTKSCTTIDDPYASTWPTPSSTSCTYSNGNYNGGSVTLNPGTYCGWFNFNSSPTVVFNPGTYVVKNGGWNVNGGTWTGSGVTFFFADTSKIQFNSAVKTALSAPTSGTYKGLLFGEPSGLSSSQFVFNTANGHNLKGVMHLPSRQVTFNSGADVTTDELFMVFDTLILNAMTWNFTTYGSAGSSNGGTVYLAQ